MSMGRAYLALVLAILCISAIPLISCSQGSESTQISSIETEVAEVVLSDALSRDCQESQSPVGGNFDAVGLRIGEKAIDFTLKDVTGDEYRLSQLLADKPVMMVFGSCT